ncbi:MAG: SPOR domain-containing protein [Novosphingobium sp.]|nr:SPOR domain-containing protein [Novosphingobium sp.]
MAGNDPNDPGKDGRKSIFTGEDLPPEDAIPPAGTPVPPRWDEDAGEPDYDYGDTPPFPPRLGLDDGDERLPWLESADDIDAEEGFDSGRIIGFLLLGLVALAMIVGAVWFASNRGTGEADGSLIRADAGPYKVAPEDPGGKKFAGTGDTSYAVAQGETRSGTIAGEEPAPGSTGTATPEPATSAMPVPKASPSATATASPAATGGVGVQVGAYTSAADAEKGWSALVGRHEALSGVKHRVIEGQADFGRVFRLQAVAGDLAAANALCASLKASGQGCQVKR